MPVVGIEGWSSGAQALPRETNVPHLDLLEGAEGRSTDPALVQGDRGRPARMNNVLRNYSYAVPAAAVTCCWPEPVQMICSRPGPTPTSTIGTPVTSRMKSR